MRIPIGHFRRRRALRTSSTLLLFAAISGLIGCTNAKPDSSALQNELVKKTQELFDAVTSGDQKPWKNYIASDAMYFDEKGRNMDKTALVNDVTPLPEGMSGAIKLVHPQSRIVGNTAILSYDLDESETVFGQDMTARYHETDTWMRRNGEWQIIAGQAFRYYEDPAPGVTQPAKYRDYVGTYELAKGRDITVSVEGEHLYTQRPGKEKLELIPESGDIFFQKGVEGRHLFRRDTKGKVDAMIDRRNNGDILWKKLH